jgi:arylsulfatase A-like enzyme
MHSQPGRHSHRQYSHKNGVYSLEEPLDPKRNHVAKELQSAGYQTAMIGKWHLVTEPTGFDYWNILPGQGIYHNPAFLTSAGASNTPATART